MKWMPTFIIIALLSACAGPAHKAGQRQAAPSNSTASSLNAEGMQYFAGRGQVQNYPKAEQLFLQAAQQGSVDAHSNLGYLYELGKLGRPDYSRARKHYEHAANQKHTLATRKLAQIHLFGKAGRPDRAKAMALFESAAEAGDVTSQKYLAWLLQRERAPAAIKKAVEWWHKAARNGSLDAQYELGKLLSGMKIHSEAKTWLGLAAERGHVPARRELGRVLLKEKSPNWLSHSVNAAKRGDVEAMNDLAHAYYRGKGTKVDYSQARRWAEIGANFGSAKAMNLLGVTYARGHGIGTSAKRACYWFSRAAKLQLKEARINFASCSG